MCVATGSVGAADAWQIRGKNCDKSTTEEFFFCCFVLPFFSLVCWPSPLTGPATRMQQPLLPQRDALGLPTSSEYDKFPLPVWPAICCARPPRNDLAVKKSLPRISQQFASKETSVYRDRCVSPGTTRPCHTPYVVFSACAAVPQCRQIGRVPKTAYFGPSSNTMPLPPLSTLSTT